MKMLLGIKMIEIAAADACRWSLGLTLKQLGNGFYFLFACLCIKHEMELHCTFLTGCFDCVLVSIPAFLGFRTELQQFPQWSTMGHNVRFYFKAFMAAVRMLLLFWTLGIQLSGSIR